MVQKILTVLTGPIPTYVLISMCYYQCVTALISVVVVGGDQCDAVLISLWMVGTIALHHHGDGRESTGQHALSVCRSARMCVQISVSPR